ncbi:MAG: hypothetical protein P8J37_01015 [Fuerstiella sp.]|nr:hypothetical protein [Fuerstiella sp.]
MALFSSTQISWNEPWFFLVRIRTARSWMPRMATAFVVMAVMFLATYFFDNGRFALVEAALLSLVCGLVVLLLLDKGNVQREVSVQKDCIVVNSAMGRTWHSVFKLEDIEAVELMRADEWSYSVNGMVIDHGDEGFLVAVPPKVSLETLANILYRLDLAVSLSDWEPPEGDPRTKVKDDLQLDAERAVGVIDTKALEGEEKKLVSPVQIGIQLVIGLGPLLLGLIGAVVAGIYLYRHLNELDIVNRSLIGGGAFAGLVAGFLYLIKIGLFVSSAYAIKVGRASMQSRVDPLFSGLEDDLVALDLYGPEKWTKPGMEDDFGFLQIDRDLRLLWFEGNTNRWTLPFSALTSCRIEEAIMGSEGNENAERRYFVVLSARQEGEEEDWENGLIYVRTEIGNDSHERRYDRSRLLFTQLSDAIGG